MVTYLVKTINYVICLHGKRVAHFAGGPPPQQLMEAKMPATAETSESKY
jgi:hypothetical protein